MVEKVSRYLRFSPFHKHQWQERYGGVYADKPGGPRSVHEIWWECECGAILDPDAKQRAELADAALSNGDSDNDAT